MGTAPPRYGEPVPSYRVTLAVGALAPGTAPAAVLPEAARLVAELTVVEAQDVRLLRGVPCAVVRFEAPEDDVALTVAEHAVDGLGSTAEVRSAIVTRRDGPRWTPVR
ncbi:hypothetical protein GCM10017714_01470 [Curtobacterium pusillum]|nr:hypothetical protein GCM10017610_16450 [Curtobacterium pusillum]